MAKKKPTTSSARASSPRPKETVPPMGNATTQAHARTVFRLLFEEDASAEAIIAHLTEAGLTPESIEQLLEATRSCLELAEDLPDDAEDVEADDFVDMLVEERGLDADFAQDVVDAFFAMGDEL